MAKSAGEKNIGTVSLRHDSKGLRYLVDTYNDAVNGTRYECSQGIPLAHLKYLLELAVMTENGYGEVFQQHDLVRKHEMQAVFIDVRIQRDAREKIIQLESMLREYKAQMPEAYNCWSTGITDNPFGDVAVPLEDFPPLLSLSVYLPIADHERLSNIYKGLAYSDYSVAKKAMTDLPVTDKNFLRKLEQINKHAYKIARNVDTDKSHEGILHKKVEEHLQMHTEDQFARLRIYGCASMKDTNPEQLTSLARKEVIEINNIVYTVRGRFNATHVYDAINTKAETAYNLVEKRAKRKVE